MRRLAQAVRPAVRIPTPPVRATAPPRRTAAFEQVRAVVTQPGSALPSPVRTRMETGFGHDLGHVRVHDAPVADTLDARAFSLGSHVVFAPGQYRPDNPAGLGLLAHEIAHVLQDRGPGRPRFEVARDRAAEAEADQAVRTLAAGGRPELTPRPGGPVIRRAAKNEPTPALETETATKAGKKNTNRLPSHYKIVTDTPDGLGTTRLVVEYNKTFALPTAKGHGPWIQQVFTDVGKGGGLIFSPVIDGETVSAYKEGKESYKRIWLDARGFASLEKISEAITEVAKTDAKVKQVLADPEVKRLVADLAKGLQPAGCDIDHIVELQMGGSSFPANLQLLTSTQNQEAGRQTFQKLVELVDEIRAPSMRGPKVRDLHIHFKDVTIPKGTADASSKVEGLLRDGSLIDHATKKPQAAGTPVRLTVAGRGEVVNVRDGGPTPLGNQVRRLIPGMRIKEYHRTKKKGEPDTVTGALDSRAKEMAETTAKQSEITLEARVVKGDPDTETRQLVFGRHKNKKIAFFYPYLSPGELTSADLDGDGGITGKGVLNASVPFLGRLAVEQTHDTLALVAPIPAAKLLSPLPGVFRFTGGQLALQLVPDLVPSGTLAFIIGPAARPVLNGSLDVTMRDGGLTATGKITPAGKLPGLSAAEGLVEWNSRSGWSGKITATSAIPRMTANVELGFTTAGGLFAPYATGGITTSVRDAQLVLTAHWDGRDLGYTGSVTLQNPLPLVKSVNLAGRLDAKGLRLTGDAAISWQKIDAAMRVVYERKEEEPEGRLSGTAKIVIRTDRAHGEVELGVAPDGRFTGKGSVAYQLTKDLRPVLGVQLTDKGRVRLTGEVSLGDIVLVRRWPTQGGHIPLLAGARAKFSVPTPVPGTTAFIEVTGALSLGYGVGPVVLRGLRFAGGLYLFEDDPQVAAKIEGVFAVPAYAELAGTFGAAIGAEVLLGAAGVKGGLAITPKLRVDGEGALPFSAAYDKAGLSFAAEAYAKGKLTAMAQVSLFAEIFAAWGVFSHRWTYEAASVSAQIGPELKLSLGRIAYEKDGKITWPDPSQIKVEPSPLDPVQVIKDMLQRGKGEPK